MILYTLHCPADHRFEAWFKDSAAYERQAKRGLISCPVCHSSAIDRAPMAPRIAKGKAVQMAEAPAAEAPAPENTAPNPADTGGMSVAASPELMKALRDVVEKHCENVGDRFAEEARRMHYGEAKERGIYGRSTPDETKELLDEGIEVMPLPWNGRNA